MKKKEKILFQLTRQATHLTLLMIGLSFIICCGDIEDKETFLEGVFIDGPVSGVSFETDSISGQTDSIGVFKYKEGETVAISIGDILLGKTEAQIMISPVDLVPDASDTTDSRVSNIAVFLQTLDHDGRINNGIQIPSGIDEVITESITENGALDFDQSTKKFIADKAVTGLLDALNEEKIFSENSYGSIRNLIPAQDAQAHLKAYYSNRKEAVTTYGKVNGFALNEKTWAWFGIPYAKPPLGDLRWQAPQAPDPWQDDLDTVAHCMPCIQPVYEDGQQSGLKYVGSEDCLYLDIYRPKSSATNLPVYIWIHGGFNNMGAARDYNGSSLAQKGKMVVVVIQYRLGPMGWFTHPALRNTDDMFDASGNYGMLDHIEALKWVKQNISAFGGNPNNVTIGGQSSGAHNSLNLLISSAAKGLFHKAVVQSATMDHRNFNQGDRQSNAMIDWLLMDDETVEDKNAAVVFRSQMTNDEIKKYLRNKTATKIIAACQVGVGNEMIPFNTAFQDGIVLPKLNWLDAIASGSYNKVPLLIGSNEYEFNSLLSSHGKIIKRKFSTIPSGNYTWRNLFKVLDKTLNLNDVFPTQRDKDFFHTVGHLKSRMLRANNVDAIARTLKTHDDRTPVYVYRFDWSGGGDSLLTDFDFIFGASHGMEIPFFFGNSDNTLDHTFTQTNQTGRVALQEAMLGYLSRFVKNGNPNLKGSLLPKWPKWSNNEDDSKIIVFDAGLSGLQLNVSNEEEVLPAVLADVVAAKVTFNQTDELECMDYFGLSLPEG
jgi:para-nitrobenzyl esterase